MGIDFKKMKNVQADLKKRAGGDGDKLFVYSSKLKEEDFIRILPPPPKMNGAYFMEELGWWVNGTFVVSHKTFGGPDIVKEEVDAAREYASELVNGKPQDPELLALLDKKKDGKTPVIKQEGRYLLPILHCECKFDADEALDEVIVLDDMAKILVAKPSLMVAINEQVTARINVVKGVEDGVADRVQGKLLIVGKTGQGLDTKYTCTTYTEVEMPEKYYKDVPDVEAVIRKNLKSEEATRSIIRNYLYGEPIIEDKKENAASTDAPKGAGIKVGKKTEEPAAEETTAGPKKPKVGGGGTSTPTAGPKKPKVGGGTADTGTGSRSLLDDAEKELDNLG